MTRMVHGTTATNCRYDKDGREIRLQMGDWVRTTAYDKLGRIESQSWEEMSPSVTRYHYPEYPDNTTHEGNLPEQVENAAGTFTYLYDKNGNITQIGFTAAGSTAEVVERYQYDELNQLIREDSGSQDKTFVYEYDLGGNRVKKTVVAAGEEGGTGTTTVTTYCMAGDLLVSETRTTGNVSSTLWYQYDSSGMAVAVRYSGNRYVYLRNLQNDVIGLLDSEGALVVRYEYDSWGRVRRVQDDSTDDIGVLNPFRYRGYYYDAETGFYYVSSRYYDPGIGRFISADEYITTGQGVLSYNMYAYCLNNPVNRSDPTGNNSSLAQMWTSTMWWLYAVDSVLPLGDMIYLGGALLLGAAAINSYSSTTITVPNTTTYKPTTDSKAKEEEKVNAVTKPNPSSTPIYRYGGTNPGNLVPREKDVLSGTGLSFSTVSRPGAAMTTMEAVNSTGVLIAIKDGPTHVSVYPVGTTMEGWRNAGTGSIWTMTIKSIVIKWTP